MISLCVKPLYVTTTQQHNITAQHKQNIAAAQRMRRYRICMISQIALFSPHAFVQGARDELGNRHFLLAGDSGVIFSCALLRASCCTVYTVLLHIYTCLLYGVHLASRVLRKRRRALTPVTPLSDSRIERGSSINTTNKSP